MHILYLAYLAADEGCAASHRLKWGPLSQNDIGSVAQQKEGKGNCIPRENSLLVHCINAIPLTNAGLAQLSRV